MRRKLLTLCLFLPVLLAGCGNPTATPFPTATPIPAPTGVIVPLDQMTITPRPTPTLSFDVVPVMGRWLLDFRFEFTNGEILDRLTFSTSMGVEVDGAGKFSGRGEMSVTPFKSSCDVTTLEGGAFWVTVSGYVEPAPEDERAEGEEGAEGQPLRFVAELTPEDGLLYQTYQAICPDSTFEFQSQVLWQALRSLNLRTFYAPARVGGHTVTAYEIRSPVQKELNHDLEVTFYVGQ
ncbi:MAG: hypothetical protein JXB47_04630 [Anaerolineae bacterium]|nr:hypothetical protein [Anaerolineae bacterium]